MEAEVGVVVEEDIDIQRERLIGVALGSVVVKRRKKNSVGGAVGSGSEPRRLH